MRPQTLLLLMMCCILNCAFRACGLGQREQQQQHHERLGRQGNQGNQGSRYGVAYDGREKPIYRPGAGYIFRGTGPNFGSSSNVQHNNHQLKSSVNTPYSQPNSRPSPVGVGAFSYGGSAGGFPVHNSGLAASAFSGKSPNRLQAAVGGGNRPQQQQQQQQNSVRPGPFGNLGGAVHQQFQ